MKVVYPSAAFVLLIVMSTLGGCRDDTPNLANFTSYIGQATEEECKKKCRFVSVAKTDGQQLGGPTYMIMANVTVQAIQDLSYFGPSIYGGFIVVDGPRNNPDGGWRNAKSGTTATIPVRLRFQKYESGWKIIPRTSF